MATPITLTAVTHTVNVSVYVTSYTDSINISLVSRY